MSNPSIAAYEKSPFDTQPQQPSPPALRPLFEAEPLPRAGAYDSVSLSSVQSKVDAINRQRLYALYTDPHMVFAYISADDGATVTIAPKYVEARSSNGWKLLYDRKADAYDLIRPNSSLAVLADGTVRAKEFGNTIESRPDGSVVATAQNGMHNAFPAATFDADTDLVANGYLSKDSAANFVIARRDHSLGQIPAVTRNFAISTTKALNNAQWIDAGRKATAQAQKNPKPPKSEKKGGTP